MAGIFLSHSSGDKAFVTRLAADLVSKGIPVWFDSWELETGESLLKRIFDGIDDSTYLILALSPQSIESKWVQRELEAALVKEDQLNRKVILPIKIAECQIPLSIAGRVYSDFTRSYLIALEKLEEQLLRSGVQETVIPFEQQLIPLRFSKGLYLEQVNLQSRIDNLSKYLKAGDKVSERQIIIVSEAAYEELRVAFIDIIENFETYVQYTPDTETYLNNMYQSVRRFEQGLIMGTVELINGMSAKGDLAFLSQSEHWYARIIRNELLARFAFAWKLKTKQDKLPPICENSIMSPLSNPMSAAKLYGVNAMTSFDIFNKTTGEYFKVLVDKNSEIGKWYQQSPHFPDKLMSFWEPMLIYQYLIPQMLARHCVYYQSAPLVWDLSEWMIGLS